MPIPVILDTDIGTDIDDAYALVLAATSPEIDLRAVVTVNNDVDLRACIARRLLDLMGRQDVPVIAGTPTARTPGVSLGWIGHEGQGIDLSDPSLLESIQRRPFTDAVAEAIVEGAFNGNPLTIVPIGPMTNVAAVIDELPGEAVSRIGHIVAMASHFAGYGEAHASREHNVACDPDACEIVLEAGLPLSIVGLNVTKRTEMTAAFVDRLASIGGPLAEALCGMHRIWLDFVHSDRSPMHDPLAVASLIDASLLRFEQVAAWMTPELRQSGAIVYDRPEPGEETWVRVATSVDAEAFHTLLYDRIEQAVRRAA